MIVPKSQLRGFSARPAFLLGASLEHGLAAHHHIQAADCSAVIAIEEYHPVDPSSDPLPTRRSVRGQRTGMAFSSLASGRTTCRRMSSARVFSSSRPSSRRSPACASSYSNRWLSKAQELCWTSKGPSGPPFGTPPSWERSNKTRSAERTTVRRRLPGAIPRRSRSLLAVRRPERLRPRSESEPEGMRCVPGILVARPPRDPLKRRADRFCAWC